jgi:hypothetical protein
VQLIYATLLSTDVWAVGDYSNNPGQYSFIVHWNGTNWSQITGPSLPPGTQLLRSIAAISANDIWAVGYYCAVACGPDHPDETLAVHWNGTQWTRVATPTGENVSFLLDVTAVSTTEVWAVGKGLNDAQPIIERWNGSQWILMSSPAAGELHGVSAVSGSNVWAVGSYYDAQSGDVRPLVEHYTLCPGATPSATNTVIQATATAPLPTTSTGTNTPTALPTQTAGGPSATTAPSNTAVAPTATSQAGTATSTPEATATSLATAHATGTTCTISFTDVPPDSTFYVNIKCLACRDIISGYDDGTFRPFNDITRGQIAKIVSNAAGYDDDPGAQIYEDVPSSNTFYQWINRLSMRGHMGGYPCGTTDAEPCNPPDERPYFRPFANATRGQLAKIVANAAEVGGTPSGIFYTDVQEDHPFYTWIMRLTELDVMGGYECGGVNEPCDDQGRPYFRPFNNVTRGQASKIVANTFFPNCGTR